MRIAVFANTPAQVHFYKNIVEELRGHGHEVRLLLRDYGETLELADELELPYFVYSRRSFSKMGRILSLPRDVITAHKYLRTFGPEVVTGYGVYDAFTAALLKSKCITFDDSEPNVNPLSYSIQFKAYMRFVDSVVTPSWFISTFGEKQVRVAGLKELAYLHPSRFKPNPSVIEYLGGGDCENIVVLRFNAFDALHDVGIRGFTLENKMRLVRNLEKYARVFISCESDLPQEFDQYLLRVPKHMIHDVLYYAKLVVADTGTITTEAACLGTPAILMHPRVRQYGNFMELEKYGLIFCYENDFESVLHKAEELIIRSDLKDDWNLRRQRFLKDKVDMTKFMVWYLEKFPDSFREMKANPERGNEFIT